jgi:hypothetical protein
MDYYDLTEMADGEERRWRGIAALALPCRPASEGPDEND